MIKTAAMTRIELIPDDINERDKSTSAVFR
jgi:hypothetical protein